MKLKNIGTTVINIGKIVILPDETAEVKEKGYENNPVINYLVKTNRLELVKEKKAAVKNDKKSETPATDTKTEVEPTATEQE